MAPNLELLFLKYFNGTYGISVQFFFDLPVCSNGVHGEMLSHFLAKFVSVRNLELSDNHVFFFMLFCLLKVGLDILISSLQVVQNDCRLQSLELWES